MLILRCSCSRRLLTSSFSHRFHCIILNTSRMDLRESAPRNRVDPYFVTPFLRNASIVSRLSEMAGLTIFARSLSCGLCLLRSQNGMNYDRQAGVRDVTKRFFSTRRLPVAEYSGIIAAPRSSPETRAQSRGFR